jgi:hypothetical protein
MEYMMFKRLAQKLVLDREKHASVATNPLTVDFEDRERTFLNKMTHSALDMYERKCDVKNFSKLVLSDPENDSHNKIMDELFSHGVKDPFDEKNITELSENTRFWRDLGL